MSTKLNKIKFGQYPPNSPYPTVKIQATPITRAMEMNNWLHEQVSKAKIQENGLTPEYSRFMQKVATSLPKMKDLLDAFINKISSILDVPREGRPGTKVNQIKCMYFRIVEELVISEEKASKTGDVTNILQSVDFHKGVLVAAAETTLFVHNSTVLMFDEILDLVEISAFDFWKLLPSFLRFDPFMPNPLIMHFNEIENKILDILAWEKKSPIHALIAGLMTKEDSKKNIENDTVSLKYAHERFFKKVLQVSAAHIEEIVNNLGLQSDVIKERIWEATKLCLSAETDLLIDRHLDHIILCGIYAVCKMEESKKSPLCESYSFNKIITCYIQLNGKKGKNTSGLFQAVKLNEKEAGDIIAFYNKVFVPRMKTVLCKLCLDTESANDLVLNKAKIRALAPMSPLKEISSSKPIMQQRSSNPISTPSKSPLLLDRHHLGTPIMTPRTQRLFAYSETSPMSRRPMVSTPTFSGRPFGIPYKEQLVAKIRTDSSSLLKKSEEQKNSDSKPPSKEEQNLHSPKSPDNNTGGTLKK